jgi:hypothetical protein
MQCFMNSNGAHVQLYRHLSCDNYEQINQQILAFVQQKKLIKTSQQFWNPVNSSDFIKSVSLFSPWLAQHNLKLHSLAVTIGTDTTCCGIHVDTPPAVNKLSWPVLNTSGTFNRWFRQLIPTPKIQTNSLGGKSYIDINELEEIGRMEVVKPCIINAGIPHDVWFDKSPIFPRVGLQCMLFNEPTI